MEPDGDACPRDDVDSCGGVAHETATPAARTIAAIRTIDFQFGSTIDGEAIKIASMIDEHARVSLLIIVERSMTSDRLVEELKKVFAAAGGPPRLLRIEHHDGPLTAIGWSLRHEELPWEVLEELCRLGFCEVVLDHDMVDVDFTELGRRL